jgi:phosphate/sulfate permease
VLDEECTAVAPVAPSLPWPLSTTAMVRGSVVGAAAAAAVAALAVPGWARPP